jgi:hypothetical protein
MTTTTSAASSTGSPRETSAGVNGMHRDRPRRFEKRPVQWLSVGLLALVPGCGAGDHEGGVTEVSSALIGVPAQIGVFRDGTWFLDANGDNAWNGEPTDAVAYFGQAGDLPVASKRCNPAAQTKEILVTRGSSQWFGTANDFVWNGGDSSFVFGLSSGPMFPVILRDRIAAVVHGTGGWLWDQNNNRVFDVGDLSFGYGVTGDLPVAGRWGSGITEGPGIFRNGLWIVDSNNNFAMDGGDAQFSFGTSGDLPVVADFNPNVTGSEIAVFRSGTWFVDFNGNRTWDGGDQTFYFGQAGDIPVVAIASWRNDMCFP